MKPSNRKLRKSRNRYIKSFVRQMTKVTIKTAKFAAAMANVAYILKNTAQPLPKFATGGLAWEPRPIETIKEKRKYNMHVDVLPTYEPDIYKEIRDGFIKAAAARLDKDVRKGLGALDGHFDI